MLLAVSHLSKSYPGLPVLHDVSFTADAGEVLCLLGPSGSGKTTLLRLIGGLETPDKGQITFGGVDLAGVPPHRRNFGLMFQDYALFPHKDVAMNVAFGLRMQGQPRAEVAMRVREMLALVGLAGYERRRVTDLSGGEQQRVALARSLAPQPRLLMLDEPLGALDRALREQLMHDLRAILKQVGVTALYVTHDQEEAFAIADRLLVLHARLEAGQGGHVEQSGVPQEVYRRPATPYVARFLGFRNLAPGVVVRPGGGGSEIGGTDGPGREGDPSAVEPALVDTALGRLAASPASNRFIPGERVIVLIRPEAAQLLPAGASGANVVSGELDSCSFRGHTCLVTTRHAGDVTLVSEMPAHAADRLAPGAPLALHLDPTAIMLLPWES